MIDKYNMAIGDPTHRAAKIYRRGDILYSRDTKMKKEICDKCKHEDTRYCCLYNTQCDMVEDCTKVKNNTADCKIRVRAKRLLRRHGIKVDNNTNNSTLVLLVKMFRHMMRLENQRPQSNKKLLL